jgi:hypothetical protein
VFALGCGIVIRAGPPSYSLVLVFATANLHGIAPVVAPCCLCVSQSFHISVWTLEVQNNR